MELLVRVRNLIFLKSELTFIAETSEFLGMFPWWAWETLDSGLRIS